MQRSSSLMTKGRKVRSEESDEIKRGPEGLARTKESSSVGEETSLGLGTAVLLWAIRWGRLVGFVGGC